MLRQKLIGFVMITFLALPLPVFGNQIAFILTGERPEGILFDGTRGMATKTDIGSQSRIHMDGAPDVPTSPWMLKGCTDSALKYINCDNWLQYVPDNGQYFGTIVVIDDGLSVGQWKDLEDRGILYWPYVGHLDIIGVLTPDTNEKPRFYTDPNTVTDAELGYSGDDHAYKVMSALMTVARGPR